MINNSKFVITLWPSSNLVLLSRVSLLQYVQNLFHKFAASLSFSSHILSTVTLKRSVWTQHATSQ